MEAAARGTTVVDVRMLLARTPARRREEADVRSMVEAAEELIPVGTEWRWVQLKRPRGVGWCGIGLDEVTRRVVFLDEGQSNGGESFFADARSGRQRSREDQSLVV